MVACAAIHDTWYESTALFFRRNLFHIQYKTTPKKRLKIYIFLFSTSLLNSYSLSLARTLLLHSFVSLSSWYSWSSSIFTRNTRSIHHIIINRITATSASSLIMIIMMRFVSFSVFYSFNLMCRCTLSLSVCVPACLHCGGGHYISCISHGLFEYETEAVHVVVRSSYGQRWRWQWPFKLNHVENFWLLFRRHHRAAMACFPHHSSRQMRPLPQRWLRFNLNKTLARTFHSSHIIHKKKE